MLLVGLPAYHSINSPYFSTSNEAKKLYQKISLSKAADAPFNLYNLLKAPSIINITPKIDTSAVMFGAVAWMISAATTQYIFMLMKHRPAS